MLTKPKSIIASSAMIVILISGCRGTEEYKRLATAGQLYTTAVNELTITAGDLKIDTTSEQLLLDDELENQGFNEYDHYTKLVNARLEILNDIRQHNLLLARYFTLLNELASSDAPQKAETEINGIAGNINTIGTKLRGGNSLLSDTSIFGSIAKLVLQAEIRGALKKELEQRKDTINLELITQKEFLSVIGQAIETDLKVIKGAKEGRLVTTPLFSTDPISSKDSWIENRRLVLKMEQQASQFKDASKAAQDFGDIFRGFVEGDLNKKGDAKLRLDGFLTDIESLLVIINNIN